MTGLDVHDDTPTEILHTVLLGIVKYYWAQTMFVLEKDKHFDEFRTRLNSFKEDGLDIPNIRGDYMCQFKGGLNGKHFKTISQIMPFLIYNLVEEPVRTAWLLIGRLTVLLWHTKIDNTELYLVCGYQHSRTMNLTDLELF